MLLRFLLLCVATLAFRLPPSQPVADAGTLSARLVGTTNPAVFISQQDLRAGGAKRQAQVRDASKVVLDGTNVTSFAGFLSVRPEYNSSLFYWFIPALERPLDDAPLILWLQGGPGGSSMFGLFGENGPFTANADLTLGGRDIHWAKRHHMLYIDNPVGTGFSFTQDPRGYPEDVFQCATDLYTGLQGFFTLFAEYQPRPFFIAGESYAGKYIPALAHTIHTKQQQQQQRQQQQQQEEEEEEDQQHESQEIDIKLTGISMGDALSDPINQVF
jgi:carboxypeptidase C (cathepsin A)